jgi:hypothetical protein
VISGVLFVGILLLFTSIIFMKLLQKYLITGNARDEAGGSYKDDNKKTTPVSDKSKSDKKKDKKDTEKDETKEKSALQQWANDNARDIAEDDSTPLRSGL